MAAYISSVEACATPKSGPSVVLAHHDRVDRFDLGRTTREMINATIRSRARHGGPSNPASLSLRAIAATAAMWPCGSDRELLNSDPADTSACPISTQNISSDHESPSEPTATSV